MNRVTGPMLTYVDEERPILSVTEVTSAIKDILSNNFVDLIIEGEISNYKLHHSSGHRYFSLKDANATLSCAMWKYSATSLKFNPEDGMKVQAFGSIDVYPPRGSYQLIVKRLRPIGAGELEIAFRQLYEKLSKQGLFNEDRKKPIPEYPFTIGIVTSPTGAAIRDMLQIFRRRNDLIKLIIYPSAVQGDGAENEIAAGIEYFNDRDDIDIIITGRGGGSLEDLWCFNTETVVRAIAASRIPIVCGVGHEVDTTLADLAADLRAPTPSAAAELTSWLKDEAQQNVIDMTRALAESLEDALESGREELRDIITRGVFKNPMEIVTLRSQTLDIAEQRFALAVKNSINNSRNMFALRTDRLDSLSPLKTLSRGYAVARALESSTLKSGSVIRDAAALKSGDTIEVIVSKGRVTSEVKTTHKDWIAR